MTGTIAIENMEFFARHGCYDLEQIVGNKFQVNLWLETDVEEAAINDDINRAVNYLEAYSVVERCMNKPSRILENVAKRIIDDIHEKFPQVMSVKVSVSKLAPPLGGKVEKVSLTLFKVFPKA